MIIAWGLVLLAVLSALTLAMGTRLAGDPPPGLVAVILLFPAALFIISMLAFSTTFLGW